MARIITKTQAVVLRTRRMGETSKLVTLFSEGHGKLRVTAKGARRPKSKFGGSLEVTQEIHAVCYVRDDRDLHALSDAEPTRGHPVLLTDLRRLSYAAAACEMIDRLTIEHEPNPRLYACIVGVLGGFEEVEPEQLESLFWYFQLRVAEALGYRPELSSCANCGDGLDPAAAYFSPNLGGGICVTCSRDAAASDEWGGEGDGWAPAMGATSRRVSGESLQMLAQLQAIRTYAKEVIPLLLADQRGEVRGMLRSFLEYHAGANGRLRSLEFLESIG